MATRKITATDPVTGQTVTRRTARTYHAAVVWTAADGTLHAHAWCGRPDLAAAALTKVQRAGVSDARLAPVTGDPWADPLALALSSGAAALRAERVAAPTEPDPKEMAQALADLSRNLGATVAEAMSSRNGAPTRYGATGEPTPPSLAPYAADLGRSLGLAAGGKLPAARRRRPVLPGEPTPPPAPVAQGPGPDLPALRADAAAGRPVSLARLAQALADDLATPGPTPDSLRARAATRAAEGDRLAAAGDPDRAAAAVAHAEALTGWADQLSPAPTGDAWAGQPWDPGTPDARARVALQGERVATLWPIAQALTGAGVTLPPSWATDGPVMAGELPYADALAALPLGAIAQAAAALAALPPVTAAQARALTLCRGGAV